MRAAYDGLDEQTKADIEDLVCEHSLIYSREAIGFFDLTPQGAREFSVPVRHRLVRRDARTGRKSLFLSAHAGAIDGWSVPEARLSCATSRSTRRSRPSSTAICGGSTILVIWDNRTTMHRARPFARDEIRDMRRTTLAGEAA